MAEMSTLRYLKASCVKGNGCSLAGLSIQAEDEQVIGELMGVLLDPRCRRVHYFVVQKDRVHSFLVPLSAMQLDPEVGALRVLAADDFGWLAFDPAAFPEFSADDALEAMFAGD